MTGFALGLAATAAAGAALAPAALAVPNCPSYTQAPKTLISGRGTLESVIVDPRGRLYFTDVTAGELLRVNRPGAKPVAVVKNITAPGGLAFDRHKLIVGYGDAIATASSTNPQAGLIIYNPKTGKSHQLISGTQMSNGIARGPDGAIYASSDVGLGIDRVFGGQVEINWGMIASPNGLSVSRNGKWLYSNQTFVPAQISRIEIADPTNVQVYVKLDPPDAAAGLDGMTRDRAGNLYVAANGGGWVGRVASDRTICQYASGLGMVSAVALGHGKRGFSRHNLYAVNFGGELVELPKVR